MTAPDQPVSGEPTAVEIVDLHKRFGDVHALAGVSFEIGQGEILGLLGPNGAGKTTIVNILATLMQPDQGQATVAGYDVVNQADQVRESIALTGQFAAVDEVLTGFENLVLFARLRGASRRQAQDRATDLLERFSLTEAGDRPVGGYSGGMRRRLDLAASLVAPAPVVCLDEPTTGLDPRSRAELWSEIRRLKTDGRTVVLTTQYLEEADQLADRIIVIDRGRVVAEGTPEELKARSGSQACVLTLVDLEQQEAAIEALTDLGEAVVDDELGTLTLADCGADRLTEIMKRLDEADIRVAEVALRRPTLDEVFLELTGSAPEEAE
ncbi:MAG: ATP-binding cassette domain-containing protein [Actinomycetota bacterium]